MSDQRCPVGPFDKVWVRVRMMETEPSRLAIGIGGQETIAEGRLEVPTSDEHPVNDWCDIAQVIVVLGPKVEHQIRKLATEGNYSSQEHVDLGQGTLVAYDADEAVAWVVRIDKLDDRDDLYTVWDMDGGFVVGVTSVEYHVVRNLPAWAAAALPPEVLRAIDMLRSRET